LPAHCRQASTAEFVGAGSELVGCGAGGCAEVGLAAGGFVAAGSEVVGRGAGAKPAQTWS
jgi:hypothetical protein